MENTKRILVVEQDPELATISDSQLYLFRLTAVNRELIYGKG